MNVHTGPCNCVFWITGQHFAWTVCIFWSCACHHGPNWGWLERRLVLPYFSWCLSWLGIRQLFLFNNVYSNTLGVCLLWLLSCVPFVHSFEGSGTVLMGFFWSLKFSTRFSEVVSKYFLIVPAWDELFLTCDPHGGFYYCRWVFERLIAHVAVLLLGSWSFKSSRSSWGFSKVLWKTAP